MDDTRARLTRFAWTIAWHRRLLAGGLAAAAVALAIEAASPGAPATVDVPVAARDLDGGVELGADDLRIAEFPPDTVPSRIVDMSAAVGRVLAAPMGAGEPLTDHRLVGESLLDGWGPDLVASAVRIADPGSVGFVRPGDRVDLLAAAMDGTGAARVVATGVPVLAASAPADDPLAEGALVVVATSAAEAADLATASVTARLSFTLRAA
jgi:Flp pilus assembly protein CpaB